MQLFFVVGGFHRLPNQHLPYAQSANSPSSIAQPLSGHLLGHRVVHKGKLLLPPAIHLPIACKLVGIFFLIQREE
jgi:hypothetical protein